MMKLFIVLLISLFCLSLFVSAADPLPGGSTPEVEIQPGGPEARIGAGQTGVAQQGNGQQVKVTVNSGQARVGNTGSNVAITGDQDGTVVQTDRGTYTLNTGDKITRNDNGDWEIERARQAQVQTGLPRNLPRASPTARPPRPAGSTSLVVDNIVGGTFSSNGDYILQTVERLEQADFLVKNGQGVHYIDGIFSIDKADRIEIKDGILTQVVSFKGTEIEFHVGSTKDVIIGCLAMRQVRDSDFTINDNNIIIEPAKGVEFDIADCGFAQNHFKAYSENSTIVISKSKRATYEINEGELKCHSLEASETVQANASASVQYGSTCFSCMDLAPTSLYWYNSENILQDFGMHIPKEGSKFRLCLKKQPLDYFVNYDGLVDFVDKEIALTKKIHYMRYSFANNEIASLLMDTLLEDKENARVQMKLDQDFVFINEVNIALNVQMNATNATTNPLKTITTANNFIELREQSIKNETHRLLKVNYLLESAQLQQERIHSYATNYFEPKIKIANNTLTQETKKGRIVVQHKDELVERMVN